jgi:hypothetical protein
VAIRVESKAQPALGPCYSRVIGSNPKTGFNAMLRWTAFGLTIMQHHVPLRAKNGRSRKSLRTTAPRAKPDGGEFMKSLFAQPAGKSAFNFFEQSLSTQPFMHSIAVCFAARRQLLLTASSVLTPFVLRAVRAPAQERGTRGLLDGLVLFTNGRRKILLLDCGLGIYSPRVT